MTTRLSPLGVPGRALGNYTKSADIALGVAGASATASAPSVVLGGVMLGVAEALAAAVAPDTDLSGLNATLGVANATAGAIAPVPSPPTGPAWWFHRSIGRW